MTTPEYQRWREVVLGVNPEDVGVSSSDVDRVYGVIMDIGMIDRQRSADWAISTSAFASGEASFRPSVGGGMIGLGRDAKVAEVAKEIVRIAQELLPGTHSTQDPGLPEPGLVRFILLTTGGLRAFEGHLYELRKPKTLSAQLLKRFGSIRQFADRVLDKKRGKARG